MFCCYNLIYTIAYCLLHIRIKIKHLIGWTLYTWPSLFRAIEYIKYISQLIQPTISLELPVPSQGHYGFHSFPVVDWFCLFIYLWVLTFQYIYIIFLMSKNEAKWNLQYIFKKYNNRMTNAKHSSRYHWFSSFLISSYHLIRNQTLLLIRYSKAFGFLLDGSC
jgi:hypothetical protein